MEMKRAGELMIPLDAYPHVPHWFTLRQVMAIMEKAESSDGQNRPIGSRFALVFDESYNMLGIVRRRDVFRGLDPASLTGTTEVLSPSSDSTEEKALDWHQRIEDLRARAEHPINEVMRPIHVTVDYEDDLPKIVSTMIKHNVSMLPVLKDNIVVGVIRSAEVFRALASLIL